MKNPVGLRPAAWEPRTRLIVAVVVLLLAGIAVVVWSAGAEGRREAAACDTYKEQQSALQTVIAEVDAAAARAEGAASTTIIGYFEDVDREFNSVRRWQSTYPRLVEDLDQSGGQGAETTSVLEHLTQGVAEMQRLMEEGTPIEASDYTSELTSRLEATDDFCAGI